MRPGAAKGLRKAPVREISELRVRDAMTEKLVTVRPETTVEELKKLFDKHDFNAFPVAKGDRLVGIVTKLDFLRIFTVGRQFTLSGYWDLFAETVGDVMRGGVVTIGPDAPIKDAIDLMLEFRLRSIPVVERGKLVGMISRNDVMKHLVP